MKRCFCQPALGLILLLVMVPGPQAASQTVAAEVERRQALRRAMRSERPAVRALVLVELARRADSDPTLVGLILPRLSAAEPMVVLEAAVRASGLLGQAARSAVQALVRILADPRAAPHYHRESPLLRQVCDVLRPHGQVAGVELTRALSSRSAIQRWNAARCLAEPGLSSPSTFSPCSGCWRTRMPPSGTVSSARWP